MFSLLLLTLSRPHKFRMLERISKWAVKKEHFIVDETNYTNLDYCRKGFFIYRSAFRDENSEDENLDMISTEGCQVLSEVSNPIKLVFGTI